MPAPPTGKTKPNNGSAFWPIVTSPHLRSGGLGKDIEIAAKVSFSTISDDLY